MPHLGAKITLAETSIAGPALDSNGTTALVWTGTDPAHHLNIVAIVA